MSNEELAAASAGAGRYSYDVPSGSGGMDSWRQQWVEEHRKKLEEKRKQLQPSQKEGFVPAPRPPPQPAYTTPPIDKSLYDRIASTSSGPNARSLLESFTIPPRSGRAWHVPAGAIFRLSTPEGPQVGDLNLWNAENPRERFWAARTRQLQRSHVSIGDRLWSCLPYLRPMCTIVADTLAGYGVDENGARCHDLLGTRCDPYVNTLLTSTPYDYHCHSNLVRAILPYGLHESDVHDVLNVFQVTGLNSDGKYFMSPSPATNSSYIEFFAEQPLLCALSTCPGGDLSAWGWAAEGKEGDMAATCRPIKVDIWEIGSGMRKEVLEGWTEPKRPDYKGMHGMRIPSGEVTSRTEGYETASGGSA